MNPKASGGINTITAPINGLLVKLRSVVMELLDLEWDDMSQAYCTSCGLPIPDGQGRSCSMCYGDIDYGKDGYYRQWAEEQIQEEDF